MSINDYRERDPPRHMLAYEGAKQMHIDPALVMRSPTDPLTDVEKNVFGADAKLHPLTHMPLEQGSGALSADRQAAGHFRLMCSQLGDICSRYRAEGDATKRAHLQRTHEANVGNVVSIAEQLIEAKIIAKTELAAIPQL